MKKEITELISTFNDRIEEVGEIFSKKNSQPKLFYNTLDDEKPIFDIDFDKDSIYYFGLGNLLENKNKDYWAKENQNNRVISAAFYNLFLVFKNYGKGFFKKRSIQKINNFFEFYKEYYTLYDWITTTKLYDNEKIKIYKFDSPDFIIETEDKIIPIEESLAEASYSIFFRLEKNIITSGLATPPAKFTNYEGITLDNINNIEDHFRKNKSYKENIKNHFPNKEILDTVYLIPLGGIDRIFDQEVPSLIKIIRKTIQNEINLENVFFRIYRSHNYSYKSESWNSLEEIRRFPDVNVKKE